VQGLLRGGQHRLRLGQDGLRLQQQGLDFGGADRCAAGDGRGGEARRRVRGVGGRGRAGGGRDDRGGRFIVLQRRGQVFFELLQDVSGHFGNHAAAAPVLRHRAGELELGGDCDVGAAFGGGRQRKAELR